MNKEEYVNNYFTDISNVFNEIKILTPKIVEISSVCVNAIKNQNKIIFCGNGGSASQCQHLTAELLLKYSLSRNALNIISLTADSSVLTTASNDFGYESVFSKQLEGIGQKGDVIIGLSTSGNSKNVLKAFEVAKEKSITTIAFAGKDGGEMSKISDYCLIVPSKSGSHIQECHLAIGHLLCDLIEKELFS